MNEQPDVNPPDAPAQSSQNNAHFLNTELGPIGRTCSTRFEPNTSSRFMFWMSEGEDRKPHAGLEIGNIVAAHSDADDDITFGAVIEMRAYSDVDSFISDYLSHDFGNAEIEIPTDISQVVVVTCDVMRNISGVTKPLGRSRMYFPSELGIRYAYGIVDVDGRLTFTGAPIPIGIFENGDGTVAEVSVDEDFLIGPQAGHMNVSGISGLAAKTSAVQFVIKALLERTQRRVAVVMFNVKSKDLLYVDQPNPNLERDEWSRDVYTQLNISATPFENVTFFAPGHPQNPHATASLRTLPTQRFAWDLGQIIFDIPQLFDRDDWDDKMENVWFTIEDSYQRLNWASFGQMIAWIDQQIANAGPNTQVILNHHIMTWRKMRSRLQGIPRQYPGLVLGAGQGRDIPFPQLTDKSVFVIDMQMLNDRGKRLVFGRAINELRRMLEAGAANVDAIVVFVDELNKYAPSGNVRTPIKERLIDITARGRAVGFILFGAEQFSSSVDREIVDNSSTYLFGRTESNELRTPTYAMLSDEQKTKLMTLQQGRLLVRFAKFPQPIFVRFPYPPSAPGDQFEDAAQA